MIRMNNDHVEETLLKRRVHRHRYKWHNESRFRLKQESSRGVLRRRFALYTHVMRTFSHSITTYDFRTPGAISQLSFLICINGHVRRFVHSSYADGISKKMSIWNMKLGLAFNWHIFYLEFSSKTLESWYTTAATRMHLNASKRQTEHICVVCNLSFFRKWMDSCAELFWANLSELTECNIFVSCVTTCFTFK